VLSLLNLEILLPEVRFVSKEVLVKLGKNSEASVILGTGSPNGRFRTEPIPLSTRTLGSCFKL
jgi:hypothetical protein